MAGECARQGTDSKIHRVRPSHLIWAPLALEEEFEGKLDDSRAQSRGRGSESRCSCVWGNKTRRAGDSTTGRNIRPAQMVFEVSSPYNDQHPSTAAMTWRCSLSLTGPARRRIQIAVCLARRASPPWTPGF